MIKQISIVSALLAIGLVSFGQTTSGTTNLNPGGFYIKGGVNFANISTSSDGSVDDANSLTTFNIGAIADIPLGDIISLQTGLLANGQGAKTTGSGFTEKFNPWYLQVPVNFVLKLPISNMSRIFVGAGPYIQMGIAGKATVESSVFGNHSYDIKFDDDDLTTSDEEGAGLDKLKRFDFGINALAGIESGRFLIGLGYGWGLTKINSTQTDDSEDDKNKFRTFSINIGFGL